MVSGESQQLPEVKLYARMLGQGSTRWLRAMEDLLGVGSHFAHTFHENGDAWERSWRNVHRNISTYRSVTAFYNTFFNILRNGKGRQHSVLLEWAKKTKDQDVVLFHESLAKAVNSVGGNGRRILYLPNVIPKPGELNNLGLDGAIVRTEQAREQLLFTRHYEESQIFVSDLVHPDLVDYREEDIQARLSRLQDYAEVELNTQWRSVGIKHGRRFKIVIANSGGGHYPGEIRKLTRSLAEPVNELLIDAILLGSYRGSKSPQVVAAHEALKHGVQCHITKNYNPDLHGFQIVSSDSPIDIVDSSVEAIRDSDVLISTSATDISALTVANGCPLIIGRPRGRHESANLAYVIRNHQGLPWKVNDTWGQIHTLATDGSLVTMVETLSRQNTMSPDEMTDFVYDTFK